MAKNHNELRKKISPEGREKNETAALTFVSQYQSLQELRVARELTQSLVAERLNHTQGYVSKIERKDDLQLSTLREYIESLGGRLHVVAAFDDCEVELGIGDSAPTSSVPDSVHPSV